MPMPIIVIKIIITLYSCDPFYPNVITLRSGTCYHKSVCHLSSSVVCNVHALYTAG